MNIIKKIGFIFLIYLSSLWLLIHNYPDLKIQNWHYALLIFSTLLIYKITPVFIRLFKPIIAIFVLLPVLNFYITKAIKYFSLDINNVLKWVIVSSLASSILYASSFLMSFSWKIAQYYIKLVVKKIKFKISSLWYQWRSRKKTKCNIDISLTDIDNFGKGNTYQQGQLFENYIASLYKTMGFYAVTTTELRHQGKLPPQIQNSSGSGEQGVDVLVYIPQSNGVIKTLAIQCKHYSSKIGNSAIQEIYSALEIYKADSGCVITNNYFTKQAIVLAQSNNIQLIDRDSLEKIIRNTVKKYYNTQNTWERTEVKEKDLNVYPLNPSNKQKDDFWKKVS